MSGGDGFTRATLRELVRAGRAMRDRQAAWFGGEKSREALATAKQAEQTFDKVLADAERILRATEAPRG